MFLPMDQKQLVTIAVTALISVTAKEVITWLLSLAKSQVAKETTREKARKIFNKNNRAVIWDVFWLSASVFILVGDLRKTSPITRLDIFFITLWLFMSALYAIFTIWDLARAVYRYRNPQ